MSYRIFMHVSRGTMDKTLVCVFPWEKPLIEEVHGGSAHVVTVDELCDLKDVVSVTSQKLQHPQSGPLLTMRQQFELMCKVPRDVDPVTAPEGEWERLVAKYGMHPEIKITVCEKVYGNFFTFKREMLRFKGSKPVPLEVEIPEDEESVESTEKPIAEMNRQELMAKLNEEKIDFPKNAPIEKLRDLVEMAVA